MPNIDSFAKSGMWDYKNTVATVAVGIPIAIEGICLIKNMIQNPGYLKNKFVEAKNFVVDSLTRRDGECTKEAVKRIAKNIFIALSCLALMAGAAYVSIHFLPAAMGISTAISAILIIGKLFMNAKTYKANLIDAFKTREGENSTAARKRITISIIKAIAFTAFTAGSIALGVHILVPLLHKFTWAIALPWQTKGVVLAEYLSMAIIHLGLCIHKFIKKDRAAALFHLTAAIAAVAFPIFYWNNEMRLHHSFYGLALMALPSRTTKILGSMVVLDSLSYMLQPLRGGVDTNGRFQKYDFINVIVDNFALFFNGFIGAGIAENINDNWAKDTQNKTDVESIGLTFAESNYIQKTKAEQDKTDSLFEAGKFPEIAS